MCTEVLNLCLSAGDALLLPIMECAGRDISCWFDPETKDVSADQTNQPINEQLSALLLVYLQRVSSVLRSGNTWIH